MKFVQFRSIRFKLAVSYLTSFVLLGLGLVLIRMTGFVHEEVDVAPAQMQAVVGLLADEIGIPPDRKKMEVLEKKLGMAIFVTSPGQPLMDSEDSISVIRDGYHYVFRSFAQQTPRLGAVIALILLVVMSAMLASFLMSRRLLRPLQKMSRVALELGVKDWKARVNPVGNDELATTGRAMDQMAERIEHHANSMFEFLATVSHELRSPLSRMRFINEKISDSTVAEAMLQEIRTLELLTGQLLEHRRLMTAPGNLLLADYDLGAWARGIIATYQGSRLPVSLESVTNGNVRFDSQRMEMALRNLIDNALKHAKNSPVLVKVETAARGGYSIEVSDSGPGMAPHLISRIGDPFLTNDPSRSGDRDTGGFGLGLSIVKAVTTAHGGILRARNLSSGGLSVHLEFPRT